jgi:lysozyme
MKLSDQGLEFIKRMEGCSTTMYYDVAGLPTIGVGHLLTRSEMSSGKILIVGTPVKWGKGLTPAQCNELLRQDLNWAVNALGAVLVPLTQHQFDALVSFIFNVGAGAFRGSTLLKRLNAGDYDAVPVQLMRWTKAGGKEIAGLRNRRVFEVKMWEGEAA